MVVVVVSRGCHRLPAQGALPGCFVEVGVRWRIVVGDSLLLASSWICLKVGLRWRILRCGPLPAAALQNWLALRPRSLPNYPVGGLLRSNPMTLGTGMTLHFDSAAGEMGRGWCGFPGAQGFCVATHG